MNTKCKGFSVDHFGTLTLSALHPFVRIPNAARANHARQAENCNKARDHALEYTECSTWNAGHVYVCLYAKHEGTTENSKLCIDAERSDLAHYCLRSTFNTGLRKLSDGR